MAHRVNFNVYRYGKSVHWNFSAPFLHTQKTMRLNYVMQHWVRRVLKVHQIKPFKIFFGLGGEFPFVKVIGYRRLYVISRQTAPTRRSYISVLKSGRIISPNNVLPVTSKQIVPFKIGRVSTLKRRIGKHYVLRGVSRSTKLQKAMYARKIIPILSVKEAGEQLRRLFFYELAGRSKIVDSDDYYTEDFFYEGSPYNYLLQDPFLSSERSEVDFNALLTAFNFFSFFALQRGGLIDSRVGAPLVRLTLDMTSALSAINGFVVGVGAGNLCKQITRAVWLSSFVNLYKKHAALDENAASDFEIRYEGIWRSAVSEFISTRFLTWLIRKSFQIIDHSSYASLKTRGGEQFAESAAMYLRLLFFLVTIFKKSSIAAVAGEENGFKRASALAPGVEALLRRLYFIRKCAKKGFIFNGRAGSTRDPLRLCFQTLAHDSQIRLCATFNFVLFKANIFKKSPYFVQIARGRFAALYAILISGSSSGAQIAGAFSKSREVSDLYGRVREVISGKNASSFQSVAYLNTLLINEKILKQAFAGFVSAWGEKYAPVYSASMSEIRGKRAYIKPEVYVNDVADTLHLVPPTITAHEKKEAARFAAKKKRWKALASKDAWLYLHKKLRHFEKRGADLADLEKKRSNSWVRKVPYSDGRRPDAPKLIINGYVYTRKKIRSLVNSITRAVEKYLWNDGANLFGGPSRLSRLFGFLKIIYLMLVEIEYSPALTKSYFFKFRQPNWYRPHYVFRAFRTKMFPYSSNARDEAAKKLIIEKSNTAYPVSGSLLITTWMLDKMARGSTRRPHSAFALTGGDIGALDELTYADANGIVNYSIRTSLFFAGVQDSYIDAQKILSAKARSKLPRLPMKARKAAFVVNYRNPRSHRFKQIGQVYPISSADLLARLNKKHRPGLYKKGLLNISNRTSRELPRIRPIWWGMGLVSILAKNFLKSFSFKRFILPDSGLGKVVISDIHNKIYISRSVQKALSIGPAIPALFTKMAGEVEEPLYLLNIFTRAPVAEDRFYTKLSAYLHRALPTRNMSHFLKEQNLFGDYSGLETFIDRQRIGAVRKDGQFFAPGYEARSILLNLSTAFYITFGAHYVLHYYPLPQVFQSDRRMHELAGNAVTFLKTYITRQAKSLIWLNDFVLIYYASIYLRVTDILVKFIAKRFEYVKYWSQPWFLMVAVIKTLNLKTFGIAGMRIGFHGKFNGNDRAYRFYKTWGSNPCLRNGCLTGSYSTAQCKSKYGITHIHIWLTYF